MIEQITKTLAIAMDNALANLHTMTVARVENVGETTIDCKPVINRAVNGESVELTLFSEVPPIFLHGGDDYTAEAIKVGDYALIMFTERCYERWYFGDDNVEPSEMRMHDYSDGFAMIGIRPQANAIPIPEERTITGVTRMGVTEPVDFMALAGLVLTELESVKTDFDNFKIWADAHTHSGGGSGAPTTPSPTAHTPESVASDYVKAD